jgi:3-hydroxyacyl-CoA dehydrogenase/enoyl-CoA hydratase/3-hydroxybutyryl-CoA epimerase/enoyl-CoA isomerase
MSGRASARDLAMNDASMLFDGDGVTLRRLDDRLAELAFDLKGESVNKLNAVVSGELGQVLDLLEAGDGIRGLLLTSGKRYFIVGADLGEFTELFARPAESILGTLLRTHRLLNRLEDLPFPTACAINGLALGGGFEVCLACDYRVMAATAAVGQPEVNFGIIPGYGGTVRLPRLIGADLAAEWIAKGRNQVANAALAAGAVDVVVAPALLREAALDVLARCLDGTFDFRKQRARKIEPLSLDDDELEFACYSSRVQVAAMEPSLNTAPQIAIDVIRSHARLPREPAQEVEARAAVELARTSAAGALISNFHKEQALEKRVAELIGNVAKPGKAAVVGAGVMGGGVACQAAMNGFPVILKDIEQSRINLALENCGAYAARRVEKKRLRPAEMAAILNRIVPARSYAEFADADIVVEAVAENADIKRAVLAEIEAVIGGNAIVTSNTSTISISRLAGGLARPENFCGMHFFNPVHSMPLVEVIRGEHTSDETTARVAAFAVALGKKPIIVRDCPGFLVNRILFPYFMALSDLLREGARIEYVDAAMRGFGWPMGPAQLLDVIGLDVVQHSSAVLAEGYPDRMAIPVDGPIEALFNAGRFGRKSGQGFYGYRADARGRQHAQPDDGVYSLFERRSEAAIRLSASEIVERMMLPLCNEALRCANEGVVEAPEVVDLGMIYGAAFPRVHGGPLGYLARHQ